MTKTYKHKTLWWIATDARLLITTYEVKKLDWGIIYVDKELVETDREEVIEKNWIDDSVEEFYKLWWKFTDEKDLKEFREILEKHAPKQKKITEEQFKKVASDNNWGYTSLYMNRLWGLLYDNELIEDFEY